MSETKKRDTSNYTALPTWSGYIYQGLCAAYVSLRYCTEKPNMAKKYFLSLDSFEDFSILDENGLIVELHQCKCFGEASNYKFETEFIKMEKRKNDYVDEGVCQQNAEMFIHTNVYADTSNHPLIKKYLYHNNEEEVQPDELEGLISELIGKLNNNQCPSKILKQNLYYWIDTNVLRIHGKIIKGKRGEAADIAKKQKLKINDILKISNKDFTSFLTSEEGASYVRVYYLHSFNEEMKKYQDLGKDINQAHIKLMKKYIESLSSSELWNLFTRLNPQINASKDDNDFKGWLGEEPKQLFRVVNNVVEPTSSNFNWKKNGNYETPTSLHKGQDIEELCYEIFMNRSNLNVLYNYKWLVGDVDETVNSITDKIPNIIDNYNLNKRSNDLIFNPQQVGILKIEDKNNGKYD